jgi:hypothetical protein
MTKRLPKSLAVAASTLLSLSALTAPIQTAQAQDAPQANNAVYIEALGNGLLYSINYDRLIINQISVRGGFSYLSKKTTSEDKNGTSQSTQSITMLPITVSYVGLQSGSQRLELGLGATLLYASGTGSSFGYSSNTSRFDTFFSTSFGYRVQPLDGGLHFRLGIQALIGQQFNEVKDDNSQYKSAWGAIFWGYISAGYAF